MDCYIQQSAFGYLSISRKTFNKKMHFLKKSREKFHKKVFDIKKILKICDIMWL